MDHKFPYEVRDCFLTRAPVASVCISSKRNLVVCAYLDKNELDVHSLDAFGFRYSIGGTELGCEPLKWSPYRRGFCLTTEENEVLVAETGAKRILRMDIDGGSKREVAVFDESIPDPTTVQCNSEFILITNAIMDRVWLVNVATGSINTISIGATRTIRSIRVGKSLETFSMLVYDILQGRTGVLQSGFIGDSVHLAVDTTRYGPATFIPDFTVDEEHKYDILIERGFPLGKIRCIDQWHPVLRSTVESTPDPYAISNVSDGQFAVTHSESNLITLFQGAGFRSMLLLACTVIAKYSAEVVNNS